MCMDSSLKGAASRSMWAMAGCGDVTWGADGLLSVIGNAARTGRRAHRDVRGGPDAGVGPKGYVERRAGVNVGNSVL